MISSLGGEVWGELAVSQATAALFGVIVAFGWGTVGAAMVASLPVNKRPQMYLDSLVSRSYLFLIATPVMFVVVQLLSRHDSLAAAFASVAYLLPFLGASWYFIGQAKPWHLLLFDVLPQGLGIVAGVVVIQFVPTAQAFVLCLLVFNLLAVIAGATAGLRGQHQSRLELNLAVVPAMRRLRDQKHGVIAAGTGTINSNLPMIAVSAVVPGSLPLFALADKLFRFAVAGFGPVLQVVQGWIPEAGVETSRVRIRRVSKLAPVVGVLGGTALALLIPWASPVFSQGKIAVGFSFSIPFGLIFAGVLVAQIFGLACLIPLGKGAELAKSTALGAVVNVPLMFVLGLAFGGPGVAWAVGVAEIIVAAYQAVVVKNRLRELDGSGVPATQPQEQP